MKVDTSCLKIWCERCMLFHKIEDLLPIYNPKAVGYVCTNDKVMHRILLVVEEAKSSTVTTSKEV